eukprot:403375048
MNIIQRTRKNLAKFVRSCDQYGKKFELTYQNQSSFKTTFGGLMTLLAFSSLTIYFIFLFVCIVKHSSVRFNYTQYFRNMVYDKTEYVIDHKDFDLSVFLLYNGPDPTVQEDIDTYFSVEMNQVVSIQLDQKDGEPSFSWDETPMHLEKCGIDRLGGKEAQGNVIESATKLCGKDFQLKIQGNVGTKIRKFVTTTVIYCNQEVLSKMYPGKICKSRQESDDMMQNIIVVNMHMESFFDTQEFRTNPIKKTIQLYPFEIAHNQSQQFYFKISQNNAVLNDNWFSGALGSTTENFYKSKLQFSTQSLQHDRYGIILQVEYFMDETVETIERSTDTILDAFSQVGGLMGFVTFICSLLSQYFQEMQLKSTMIKKLYKFYDNEAFGFQSIKAQIVLVYNQR